MQNITIPFIVRGREIANSSSLIAYRGRDVSFHYPDPRPLLQEIALDDPVKLRRDFERVSVSEIIDFLFGK